MGNSFDSQSLYKALRLNGPDRFHEIIGRSSGTLLFSSIRFNDQSILQYLPENSIRLTDLDLSSFSKLIFRKCHFGKVTFDLSGSEFEDCDILLEDCIISGGVIDFSDTKFKSGNKEITNLTANGGGITFKSAKLGDGNFDLHVINKGGFSLIFSDALLGAGDFRFGHSQEGTAAIICNLNFTNCNFGQGDVSFRNQRFENGEISFKNAQFGRGNTDFSELNLKNTKFDAANVKFGVGDISIANSTFVNSEINIQSAKFGRGDREFSQLELVETKIDLSNAEFATGDINFSGSKFKDADLVLSAIRASGDQLNLSYITFDTSSGFENIISLNLSFADLSFKQITFANSVFLNSNLNCAALRFNGEEIIINKVKFSGESILNFSGVEVDCYRFSIGGLFELDIMSFDSAKIYCRSTFTFNRSAIQADRLADFSELKLDAAELVNFEDCSWRGVRLDFENAILKSKLLKFERNDFGSDFSYFNNTEFSVRKVHFDNSKFSGRASFADLKNVNFAKVFSFRHCVFENSFDLSSEDSFGCVVDLTRTKMNNQFSLENVNCQINRSKSRKIAKAVTTPIKSLIPKSFQVGIRNKIANLEWLSKHTVKDVKDIERLRRLKQIAGDNKSFKQSLDYRVLETQAERWNTSSGTDNIFEFCFQKLSNYGRSEVRVAFWMLMNLIGFASIYSNLSDQKLDHIDKLMRATSYSFAQIFAFLPVSRTNRIESADVLFGKGSDLPLEVIATATIQNILSVLLLFLFGLAIRNRFKI